MKAILRITNARYSVKPHKDEFHVVDRDGGIVGKFHNTDDANKFAKHQNKQNFMRNLKRAGKWAGVAAVATAPMWANKVHTLYRGKPKSTQLALPPAKRELNNPGVIELPSSEFSIE